MRDNFNIPSFWCIFESRLITSIETRNVRFFTFVFSVKGMISVILILVVAASVSTNFVKHRTRFYWIIKRKPNIHVLTRGWVMPFPTLLQGWVSHFCAEGRGWVICFYQPHFQMLRPTPSPLYFLTSPLQVDLNGFPSERSESKTMDNIKPRDKLLRKFASFIQRS